MIFSSIISFLIVLAILVFVHELGHYLAARHVGVLVERFSIGFPPRLFSRKVGETEYMISALPLGGYVKLLGQNIDDEDPSDPRNYASKSKWQRIYILLAGPLMNLAAALVLMTVVYMVGVETPAYRLTTPIVASVTPDTPAALAGFQPGDRIEAVNGLPAESWRDLFRELESQVAGASTLDFLVLRSGVEQTVRVDALVFATTDKFGWVPLVPPLVGAYSARSAAREAGIELGDLLVSVDGQPVQEWKEIPGLIQSSGGKALDLGVQRNGHTLNITVRPFHDKELDRWLIGITPGTALEQYGPLDSLVMGTKRVASLTQATLAFLGRMLSGNGSMDTLGGPVKIAEVVGEAANTGASQLLFIMAFISLQLGIFNLLPIPALDGGHIFMIGVEALKGGPLSAKLRERTQLIGLSLLLLLILVVTFNDVVNLFT